MVPVRLALQNFLSYGENVTPLEFSGIAMACLSGANGHGKSALLDAITWALWGQARKGGGTSRPHAGLLRLGTTEMWVDLTFDQEGQRYRVRRGFRRSAKSSASTLDFFLWDPDSGEFRPLMLPTAKATQERLDALLRMDYATFVNSAFLLQGHADEFTRKTPAERKQVLGDILGLRRYEQLLELAKQRRHEADRELAATAATLAALADELAAGEGVEARLAAAEGELAALADRLAALETAAEAARAALLQDSQRRERLAALAETLARLAVDSAALRADHERAAAECAALAQLLEQREELVAQEALLADLEAQRARLEPLVERRRALVAERLRLEGARQTALATAQGELARLRDRADGARGQLAQTADILARGEAIGAAHAAHERALAELERLVAASHTHQRLRDERLAAERAIERARGELELEARRLTRQQSDLQARADQRPRFEGLLQQAHQACTAAESAGAQVTALLARDQELQQRFAQLEAEATQLKARLAELEEHGRLLGASEAECPVCATPLTAVRRDRLCHSYAEQLEAAQDRLQERFREGRAIKAERAELATEVAAAQARAALLTGARVDLERAGERLADCAQAADEAVAVLAQLEALTGQLSGAEFAPEAQAARQAADAALAELAYDAEAHASLARQVAAGRGTVGEWLKLEAATASQAAAQAELSRLEPELEALEQALADGRVAPAETAALALVDAELAELRDAEGSLARLDEQRQALAHVPSLARRLAEAAERLPLEQARTRNLAERCETAAEQGRQAARQQAELQAQLLDTEAAEGQLAALAADLQQARAFQARALAERGELRAKAERLRECARQSAALAADTARWQHERLVHDQLCDAFGRDGIPALVIENAVPEIEAAANELLAALTDSRMQLRIRLQRPLQGGGERETLDLEISDELGTRSYENYSGGEAFRVDFALRLALSGLLARRAGARLRTLVIDEGFGTQDEQGLEQLVDSIHAVRHEFELVLVITHLAALKDRFETRIEVVKEPERGSCFTVVRQAA